jgi:hypothetical protein
MEPITPIIITGHTGRSNIICNRIMMVNAGGNGRGVISINTAPRKTKTYCHHIVSIML